MNSPNRFAAIDALLDWKEQQTTVEPHQAAIIEEAYYQIEAYRDRSYLDIQRAIATTAIEALSTASRYEPANVSEKPTIFLVTKYDVKSGKMIA